MVFTEVDFLGARICHFLFFEGLLERGVEIEKRYGERGVFVRILSTFQLEEELERLETREYDAKNGSDQVSLPGTSDILLPKREAGGGGLDASLYNSLSTLELYPDSASNGADEIDDESNSVEPIQRDNLDTEDLKFDRGEPFSETGGEDDPIEIVDEPKKDLMTQSAAVKIKPVTIYENTSIRHLPHKHADRPEKCPHCGSEFPSKVRLGSHIRQMHRKKADHQCPHCEKSYGRYDSMRRHVAHIHEGRLKHSCSLCGKFFPDKFKLNRHMNGVHLGRRFPCSICDVDFSQKGDRDRHRAKVHNVESSQEKADELSTEHWESGSEDVKAVEFGPETT